MSSETLKTINYNDILANCGLQLDERDNPNRIITRLEEWVKEGMLVISTNNLKDLPLCYSDQVLPRVRV